MYSLVYLYQFQCFVFFVHLSIFLPCPFKKNGSEYTISGTVNMLYSHMPYHNDTIIKQTQEDFFRKIPTSHFIVRVRKGLLNVCVWEGAGDGTETVIFWPPLLWPSTLCLFRSPDAQPRRPWAHPDGWWLSLLYLISNFSGPQTLSGFSRAPSAGCSFSYHTSSILRLQLYCPWTLSWLSYIIVQRPLDRPLDLWNGMIDRLPVEITVIQFTGHSLPVHQSMSVSWALPCPISSAKSTHALSLLAIGMCHILPVHHFVMACLLGPKVKIQHI